MKPLLAIVLIVLCLAVPLLLAAPAPVSAARAPLVLAFYYDWFDENIWKPSQVADMPAARYTSRDPQAVARQIQQARGAGIDAFVVSWLGAGNQTDDNFKIVLDQARAANFAAAVDFEVTSPFYKSRDQVVASLKNLLATHTKHPAYLRVDGKPVIFFWRQQKYSVQVWKTIRDAVDPNRQSLWIAEGTDTSYLSVFDGQHLYSMGWSQNPTSDLTKYAERTRAAGAAKIWVATAMPGNDDTRTKRAGSYVRDRRGGEFYRDTWRGAIASAPDWLIITSWNEWVEGTQIEPSVTYGDLYLNITREFAAAFKGGQPAPPRVAAQMTGPVATPIFATRAPTPRPSPTPTLIPGGVRASVTDIVRVRAEPSTDAEILGRVREGAGVVLLARTTDSQWWQIAFPDAKKRGWISAEFTKADDSAKTLPVVQAPTPPMPTTAAAPAASEPVPVVEAAEPPEAEQTEIPEVYGPPEPADLELATQPDETHLPPQQESGLQWLYNLLPWSH